MGYFANAGVILVEVIFGLAVSLFAIRVLLQLVRANFHNPVCQLFYKATNPVLMPLRRVIRPVRNFELGGALLAWLIECLKVWLLVALAGRALGPAATLVLGFADLLQFLIWLYLLLILIRVVLSWIGPDSYHPVVPVITQLTEPLLRPLRRRLPAPGGLDLSPLLLSLLLLLAQPLLVHPLQDVAAWLAR
jgi:YggT family protein